VWQVGSQTLSIEERAVRAADILDQISRSSLMDLAMVPWDSTLKASIGGEIQVRKDAMSRVETSDVHLGSGWQLDLSASG
jgi:hypothetical protein